MGEPISICSSSEFSILLDTLHHRKCGRDGHRGSVQPSPPMNALDPTGPSIGFLPHFQAASEAVPLAPGALLTLSGSAPLFTTISLLFA